MQIYKKIGLVSFRKNEMQSVRISVMTVWVSTNSKYSTILSKNDSFVCHEPHVVL